MDIILLGHILQLVGILFAFLAALFGFLLLSALRGGRLASAATFEAIGLILLAINIFILYGSAITGSLDLLYPTVFWPLSGFLTAVSFAMIAYGKWQMMKVI
jgi:predicted permease